MNHYLPVTPQLQTNNIFTTGLFHGEEVTPRETIGYFNKKMNIEGNLEKVI